ncbi:hypothetical protein ES705_07148 [subsurface metagenome]
MKVWSAEIKELQNLHETLKGQLPDLEKELDRLVKTDDDNVVLIYARRCLEVIITDLCEKELKRPRKTEPLKGIIDKLNKEEKIPSHIIASMHSLNSLSTFGAHPKEYEPEQVKPVLNNLTTIIKWYLKYKDTQTIGKTKTEEAKYEIKEPEDSTEDTRKLKKKLLILLSGIFLGVVIVIAALFIFNIIGGRKQAKDLAELEKSIAVLPFDNLSSDEEQAWFSDGITDVIINQLSKISDLRVLGRTSTLKYKEQEEKKSISEIGEELGVNFIIEGTVQRQGNQMRISVQLIRAINEDHLWSELYDREWQDIFITQSEIARLIATELKVIITPEEKQLIEKTPTTNLTAYDFYQRGREEHLKYRSDNDNREALERAEDLYHKALEYDSTFAQAYAGLARGYWDKHYWETYFSEKFLDSVLIQADIALSYDNQLAEAYTVRGNYYRAKGLTEQAIEEYDKAIKFNPNDWIAYYGKGSLYAHDDLVKWIDNFQKAASLNHGPELPGLLRGIGWAYFNAGFTEKGNYYIQEALKLDDDSAAYYGALAASEQFYLGNYEKAIEFGKKGYAIDSNNSGIIGSLGYNYMFLGQYEESLKYFKKYVERLKALGILDLINMQRIGYAYWQNGYKEEAEYYFNEQINYCNRVNELGRGYSQKLHTYYDLAGVYAFRGKKDRAYENLKIFNQKQIGHLWMVTLIKDDPLFDSIRDEPEFQQIVRDVEAKYQAEHERVRKWLEEQEML